MHLRSRFAVLPQGEITLGTARLQYLRIDCRQAASAGMTVQYGLYRQTDRRTGERQNKT